MFIIVTFKWINKYKWGYHILEEHSTEFALPTGSFPPPARRVSEVKEHIDLWLMLTKQTQNPYLYTDFHFSRSFNMHSFFFLRLASELITVANLFFLFFLLFLPKSPQYIAVYILVVGPSGFSMWDITSTWPNEWFLVHAQDPTSETLGCWSRVRELNHPVAGPALTPYFLSPQPYS